MNIFPHALTGHTAAGEYILEGFSHFHSHWSAPV